MAISAKSLKNLEKGRWKKGQVTNPNGRPKTPPDLVEVAKLSRNHVKLKFTQFMAYDIEKLESILRDKKRTTFDHMIGRIVLLSIRDGDHRRLEFLLDRLIGKVKEQVEHSLPKPTIIENIETKKAELIAAKMEAREDD